VRAGDIDLDVDAATDAHDAVEAQWRRAYGAAISSRSGPASSPQLRRASAARGTGPRLQLHTRRIGACP
jgi:hypothetical protein